MEGGKRSFHGCDFPSPNSARPGVTFASLAWDVLSHRAVSQGGLAGNGKMGQGSVG